jgi:signal transduction histidine kinase
VLSVYCQRNGVAVTIADDGVGFTDEASCGDGLGLAATAERLGRVGGTMTIGSNEDGGITVQAWLPQ